MVVIVLDEVEHLADRQAWNEGVSHPVVDQAAGNIYFFARGVTRNQPLDVPIAALESRLHFAPFGVRNSVKVQEGLGSSPLLVDARLSGSNIALKGLHSRGREFHVHYI